MWTWLQGASSRDPFAIAIAHLNVCSTCVMVPGMKHVLCIFCATMALSCGGAHPACPEHAKPKERVAVQIGATVLRAKAQAVSVEEIRTPAFQELLTRMVRAMREAPGVGLAAPQIAISKQVFVVEDTPERMAKLSDAERAERSRVPVPLRVFVNPVVTAIGEERATFFEGCLSVEGYAGLVTRALDVEVRGLNEHGSPVSWRVRGWPARILQHEYDHLQGTLYVDRMLLRSFSTVDQVRARFAGKSSAQIRTELGVSD